MTTTEQQKSILGTLILDPAAMPYVSEYVFPEMFSPTLQPVADLLWTRNSEGRGWDIAMIRDRAGKLTDDLIRCATESALIEEQGEQVRDGWVSDKTVRLYADMEAAIRKGANYWEAYATFTAEVDLLHGMVGIKEKRGDVIREAIEDIMRAGKLGGVSGIPTPWESLTRFTGGWQPGTLTYLGARPGMGKTTVCCQIALAAARAGFPTLFFSMGDLSATQLVKKMMAMETGIHAKKVQNGNVSAKELEMISEAGEELYELPIHIRDIKDVSNRVGAICDYTRRMHDRHGIALVIIDYVQQLAPDANHRGNRNNELEDISRRLKLTASLLDIPFLVPSQLSRYEGVKLGREPDIPDLRASGGLEQDADNIYFLHIPYKAGIQEDEEGRSTKFMTKILARKDRVAGEDVPHDFILWYEAGKLVERDDTGGIDTATDTTIITKRYDDTEVPF